MNKKIRNLQHQWRQSKEDCYTITREDLLTIYESVCDDWQDEIKELLSKNIFSSTVEIEKSLVKKGIEQASNAQKELLKTFFPDEFPVTKNVFTKKIYKEHFQKIAEYSDYNIDVCINIANTIGRPDLVRKALYVTSCCDVILHKTDLGGTVIEIVRK